MIWYSSSIPRVSDGLSCSSPLAVFDHERRTVEPPPAVTLSSAAVETPGETPVDVLAVGDERRGIEHPVADVQAAVHDARKRLDGQR